MTDVPIGWNASTLGEVCRIVSGATPKTGVDNYWGGDVLWVTPNDMSKNRAQTLSRGERTLTSEGYASCGARTFPKGSVIVSSRAPVGYVAIAGAEMCTNQGCKTAVPPEFIDPNYLYWYLTFMRPDLEARASGTTFQEISKRAFANTRLIWPELSEQRRIVDSLDDHFSRLDAADAYLDAANRRGIVLHNQLLEAELAQVDSEKIVLADLLTIGLANGRSVPTQDGGFPVLRLTALRDGRVDLRERKNGAWTREDASRFVVRRGDFLISRGNGSLRLVGRGGLVIDEPDPVAFPDTLIRARPDTKRITSEFLALVWNSPGVRRQIEKAAKTTAGIYKVNQQDLNAVLITVPSVEEQGRVVDSVSKSRQTLTDLMSQTVRGAKRSAALRRSLLAAAFSGQLTDPSLATSSA
jgi:type I restriction enzyme S subunit